MIFFCFSGGTDPHWRHGERVPPRQFGHAEPWRQHYPSHRYINPDPVVYWAVSTWSISGILFTTGCVLFGTVNGSIGLVTQLPQVGFFCIFSLINLVSSYLTGLLWAATRASEEVDESHKVCGQDRTLSLAIFPEVKHNFARTERILF